MKNQGSALLAVVFVISCMAIIVTGVAHLLTFATNSAVERYRYEQYQLTAEGILEYGVHLAQEHFYTLLGAGQQGIEIPELCVMRTHDAQSDIAGFLRMQVKDYSIELIASIKAHGALVCAVHCVMSADAARGLYEQGDRRICLQVTDWQYVDL